MANDREGLAPIFGASSGMGEAAEIALAEDGSSSRTCGSSRLPSRAWTPA